jgi:hypothetical protein
MSLVCLMDLARDFRQIATGVPPGEDRAAPPIDFTA